MRLWAGLRQNTAPRQKSPRARATVYAESAGNRTTTPRRKAGSFYDRADGSGSGRAAYKFVGYLDIDPTQCHPNYTADIREGVAIEYISCEPPENLKELFPEGYGACDDSFKKEETEQA